MDRKDLEAFRKVLRDEIAASGYKGPGFTAEEFHKLARRIMGAATKLERMGIKACNEPLTQADVATTLAATDALISVQNTYGIKFDCDGDPRGYVVKLLTPRTHKYNNMGGDGWGVPTDG